jgi:hypothetical protein
MTPAKPPLSKRKRTSGPQRDGKPLLTARKCENGANPAIVLNVLRKANNGRGLMEGRIYRTTVAIKEFGERSRIKIIANIGKFLREIAMRITRIGRKHKNRL